MTRAAVIGLGLIGGSLAWALKKYTSCTVIGYDICNETMSQALEERAVDVAATDMETAVTEADFVFFALAPSTVSEAVRQTSLRFKAGAVITDVASAKGQLLQDLPRLLPDGVSYIAGHPMAGSEKNGFAVAHPDLFRGRPYILLNPKSDKEKALPKLAAMVSRIGAVPIIMDGGLHDPAVASISHVPHITAAALTLLAGEGVQGPLNLMLAAGGFRDMTRVASGNPALWADICLTNSEAIRESIGQLQEILQQVSGLLDKGDTQGLRELFARAKEIRDQNQVDSGPHGR